MVAILGVVPEAWRATAGARRLQPSARLTRRPHLRALLDVALPAGAKP